MNKSIVDEYSIQFSEWFKNKPTGVKEEIFGVDYQIASIIKMYSSLWHLKGNKGKRLKMSHNRSIYELTLHSLKKGYLVSDTINDKSLKSAYKDSKGFSYNHFFSYVSNNVRYPNLKDKILHQRENG